MICPHCKEGELEYISGVEPWSTEHYQCNRCDSTYCIGVIADEETKKD